MIRRFAFLFGFLFAVGPRLAQAEMPAAISSARETAKSGIADFYAGRYALANDKLSRAFAVVPVPTLALFNARALVHLGKYVEAAEMYLVSMRLPNGEGDASTQEQARRDAKAERAQLLRRIPRLRIVVEGAPVEQVTVRANETNVAASLFTMGWMVNPGIVKITGKKGDEQIEIVENFADADNKIVTLSFVSRTALLEKPHTSVEASPLKPVSLAPQLNNYRTAAWVSFGVAATGFTLGAVTGVWAFAKKNDLDANYSCSEQQCVGAADEVSSYNRMRRISSVGFVVAAVGGLTGAVLLLNEPKAATRQGFRVAPWVGVASGGFGGSF